MTVLDLLLRPLRTRRVTEAYPEGDNLPDRGVRGTPVLNPERCDGETACVRACPTSAIAVTTGASGGVEWRLDYGLCIFCGECVRSCPSGAITSSNVFELAQVRRADVIALIETRRARP